MHRFKQSRFAHGVAAWLAAALIASQGTTPVLAASGSPSFITQGSGNTLVAQEKVETAKDQPFVFAAGDSDGDGLADADEIALKTDPNNTDSDCDNLNDASEVGTVATPSNSDNDGVIDALENNDADSDGNGTKDNLDTTPAIQITCGRFKPFAILNNNMDTTRVEVRVTGVNISAVSMPFPDNGLLVDGALVTSGAISLYDDGTHGDQQAGDGLWSRDGISSDLHIGFGWANQGFFSQFAVTDNHGTTTITNNASNGYDGLSLGLVRAELAVTPTQIQPNLFATSNLLNVVDPLGSLDVKAGAEDNNNGHSRLAKISKQLYQTNILSDQYDFLVFYYDRSLTAGSGAYRPAPESIQNSGVLQTSPDSSYSSDSRLQAVFLMNFFRNPPIVHEIMHHFASPGALQPLGFGQCSNGIGNDGSHWGVAGIGRGRLGGFDPATLVNNNDGTYSVGGFSTVHSEDVYSNTDTYAPLEMYFAGWIDSPSVPTMVIPANVDCNSFEYDDHGIIKFSAGALNTVTIDQVKTALGGATIPDVANSQKNFKMASVIVSQYPLNSAEMTFYQAAAANVGASKGYDNGFTNIESFAEVTGGRATLDTSMSATPTDTESKVYLPLITRLLPNHAPTLSAIADVTTALNSPITRDFTVTDADGNPITVSAQVSPDSIATVSVGGSGDNRTVTITPTQAGNATVSIHASNGKESATITFQLAVTAPVANEAPTMTDWDKKPLANAYPALINQEETYSVYRPHPNCNCTHGGTGNASPAPRQTTAWQHYANPAVGFELDYPTHWQQTAFPPANGGLLQGVTLSGAEGSIELLWGEGFGGACPPGYQPI